MNNLLDDNFYPTLKSSRFSKWSFANAIASSLCLLYLFVNMPRYIFAKESLTPIHPGPSVYLIIFLVFTGIILTLISIVKKEQNLWLKWLGAIVNGLWFLLIVLSLIFI